MKNIKNQKQNKLKSKAAISSVCFLFSFIFATHAFASPITSENILNSINEKRTFYGLPKVGLDPDLSNAANLKSKDMLNRNYFEHFAYNLTPWDFIKNAGYGYLYAGENLAMDFNTSEGMVDAWMNSPAHRENILNPEFRDVGIGVVKGVYHENNSERNTIMVTNMFGRKKPAIVKAFDYFVDNILNIVFP